MPDIQLPPGLPSWAQALSYVLMACTAAFVYWREKSKPKAENAGAGPGQNTVLVSGSFADGALIARLAAAIETLSSTESEQTESMAADTREVRHAVERNGDDIRTLCEEARRNTEAAHTMTRAISELATEIRLSRKVA